MRDASNDESVAADRRKSSPTKILLPTATVGHTLSGDQIFEKALIVVINVEVTRDY